MKYNFQVQATVTFFVQKECDDDEQAEEIKEKMESGYLAIEDRMDGVETDLDDIKVLNYGENEE